MKRSFFARQATAPVALLGLLWAPLLTLVVDTDAQAAAPPRPGQPYAESRCNIDPNIIMCEDFNFPQNLTCTTMQSGQQESNWINPGLTKGGPFQGVFCKAADIVVTSLFPTQPTGSPPGGNMYRCRPGIDPKACGYNACILGDCNPSTGDIPTQYTNLSPATNDLYIRFQIYSAYSPDWYWPQDGDNRLLFLYPNRYTGRTDANVDGGLYFHSRGRCNPGGVVYNDAVSFRVGSNSDSYKFYPAYLSAGTSPPHLEYCNGTGAPNGTAADGTVPVTGAYPPAGDPDPGTLFRMRTGRWYTLEFRYKLSSPGVTNGTVELWIDGIKVYSNSDLETCGNYGLVEGSCYAIHEIFFQGSWYNPFSGSDFANAQARNSYRLIDNLIISKAYIGPPSEANTSPPAPPQNLKVTKAATLEETAVEETAVGRWVINIKIDPRGRSEYHLSKYGAY